MMLGCGHTKMNKTNPRGFVCFHPFPDASFFISLGTGDRTGSDDNWSPVLPYATIQTQEPSESINPIVNDLDVHGSDTLLHFPGDWVVSEKEI